MPTNYSTEKNIAVLKSLKVVALVLFILGTGVSVSWFITFLVGLNPNLLTSSKKEHIYLASQGAKDFSKAAITYGCGLIALTSATKIEQEIKRLTHNEHTT